MTHLIFDCDGVLVDSEPLSMRIDVEILAENGVVMSEAEAHQRFVGKTFAAMLDEITREFGVDFPADTSSQKDTRLLARAPPSVHPRPPRCDPAPLQLRAPPRRPSCL